jgi:hypothetical protein
VSSQLQLKKPRNTLFSYYKKDQSTSESETNPSSSSNVSIPNVQHSSKSQIVESIEVDISSLERDPGLRLPIWTYLVNEHDNVRRAYIKLGACQPNLKKYAKNFDGIQYRKFNYTWFTEFP